MPNQYVNKVALSNGTTLIDLSQDTVTDASHIMSGYVGHLADGTQVTGTGQGGGNLYTLENIVPLQTITTDTAYSKGHGGLITSYTALIQPEEMYLVTYDGTRYVCMGFVGDSSSYNAGEYRIYTSSTVMRYMSLPFCIVNMNSGQYYVLATRDTNAHTLQVDKLTLL